MRAKTKLILILRTVFCDSSILATTSSRSFCRANTFRSDSLSQQPRCQRHLPVTYPDQDDVSRLDGHVCARADGDADVSASEGR